MFKKPRFQSNNKILYALLIVYIKLLASPSLVDCLTNDTLEDLNDTQDNLEYSNKSVSIELSEEEKERRFYNDLSKFNFCLGTLLENLKTPSYLYILIQSFF